MQKFAEPLSSTLEVGDEFYPEDVVAGFVRESIAAYSAVIQPDVAKYVRGHEKRFIQTLARIPKARVSEERCLDIGGFALTPYFLSRYFGYDVVVYNWNPSEASCSRRRAISLNGVEVEYDSVNVDLDGSWPKPDSPYSFVLFSETLEHLADPLVTMKHLNNVCRMGGSVLLTTPNSNSLAVLSEYLKGLPPWVFRYFEPDAGGTRHIFEHTPASIRQLSESSGFQVVNMATGYCYMDFSEPHSLLSKVLHLDPAMHGDVIFLTLSKAGEGTGGSPSLLYDAEHFYREDHAKYTRIFTEKINQIRIDTTASVRWREIIRRETGEQTVRLDDSVTSERENAHSLICSLGGQSDNVAYLFDAMVETEEFRQEEEPEPEPAVAPPLSAAILPGDGRCESARILYQFDEMDRIPVRHVFSDDTSEFAVLADGGTPSADSLAYLLDVMLEMEDLPENAFTPNSFVSDSCKEGGKKVKGEISEMIYHLDLFDRGFRYDSRFLRDSWSNESVEMYPVMDKCIAYHLDRFDNCVRNESWLMFKIICAKNYCKEHVKKYPAMHKYCRFLITGLRNPTLMRKKIWEKTKALIRRQPTLFRVCKKVMTYFRRRFLR